MNPSHYTVPAPLMQAIVNTLGALPWQQVHQLMGAVMAEVARQEAPAPAEPPQAPAKP
jgi:hypothetical protein